MKIIEIIQLRSVRKSLEALSAQIEKSIDNVGGQAEVFMIYRRSDLETDLAIHIHHTHAPTGDMSRVGLRLASALREYGLVEHSVWEHVLAKR